LKNWSAWWRKNIHVIGAWCFLEFVLPTHYTNLLTSWIFHCNEMFAIDKCLVRICAIENFVFRSKIKCFEGKDLKDVTVGFKSFVLYWLSMVSSMSFIYIFKIWKGFHRQFFFFPKLTNYRLWLIIEWRFGTSLSICLIWWMMSTSYDFQVYTIRLGMVICYNWFKVKVI